MYDKITIKIGSNVLADEGGGLNTERISLLVDEIAALHKSGKKIVLVSSGAVAAARNSISFDEKTSQVYQRQVLSSIGQVKLINLYAQLFEKHSIDVAQILVTKQDFRTRKHYLNMKNCLSSLWDSNVLPIVNENDAVSVSALMFTDNDELSGLMASMSGCQALLILSNVDGIYNGNPNDPESRVIPCIETDDVDLSKFISAKKSNFGRGGMLTKCRIAKKTASSGVDVHIANGTRNEIITNLVNGNTQVVHTHFRADVPTAPIKKWMAYSEGFVSASLVINKGACDALYSDKANSLLLVGVESIQGEFKKGDLVNINDEAGNVIGIGKAAYDKVKALKYLGDSNYKPVIHYDYMFLFPELM